MESIIQTNLSSVTLRLISPDDVPDFLTLITENKEYIERHETDVLNVYGTTPESVWKQLSYDRRKLRFDYGIWSDRSLVGYACISTHALLSLRQIGYFLAEAAAGRGYATASARALAEHAHAHGCRNVLAKVKAVNSRSIMVLERAGFTLLATMPHLLTYRYHGPSS